MNYYNATSHCDNSTTTVTIRNTVSENISYRFLIQRIDGTTLFLLLSQIMSQRSSSLNRIPTLSEPTPRIVFAPTSSTLLFLPGLMRRLRP